MFSSSQAKESEVETFCTNPTLGASLFASWTRLGLESPSKWHAHWMYGNIFNCVGTILTPCRFPLESFNFPEMGAAFVLKGVTFADIAFCRIFCHSPPFHTGVVEGCPSFVSEDSSFLTPHHLKTSSTCHCMLGCPLYDADSSLCHDSKASLCCPYSQTCFSKLHNIWYKACVELYYIQSSPYVEGKGVTPHCAGWHG